MIEHVKRSRTLVAAALLAVIMAFGLAFAAPSMAKATEGDLQAGALDAQAATLKDGVYKLPNFKAGPSSMFNHMVAGSAELTVSGSSATLSFTTDGSTKSIGKYSKFALGKSSELLTEAVDKYQANLPEGVTVIEGVEAGKTADGITQWHFEIAMTKAEAENLVGADGAGLYVTLFQNEKGQWYRPDSDIYLQLGDASETATYDLVCYNSEAMFKVVKATIVDSATGTDSLTFYLNGKGYPYAYAGTQDEAVKAADAKDTDKNWAKQQAQSTFDSAVTYYQDGESTTAETGYGYTIPITIENGKTSLSPDVVAVAVTTKATGEESDPNYHARNFAIDLSAKTLTVGNASSTANVSVVNNAPYSAIGAAASLEYTGYVRPYAGAELHESYPLSNEWTSKLTVNLGDNKIYDQAYVETFANTAASPWIKEGTEPSEPTEADYVKVADDGALVLPIVNEYKKTTQLGGNIIKVKMHVAADAAFAEKDTWVERTLQLDFANRTNATLTVTGDALTPEKQAMHRMYNPNSGEHFYTASDDERDMLVGIGWKHEGTGWTAPVVSSTPVYRMYNPNAGEHHYTMSAGERDALVKAGWNYEQIGWYSDDAKEVVLYREYNPNAFACNHNYTTSKVEHDWLISLGWNDEGTAWYGLEAAA